MLPRRLLALFCCYFGLSNGAKILGVFPTPVMSHQIVFRALMEDLAKRGHHVVTMTTDPVKYTEKIPTLTQIDVHDISYKIWDEHFNFVKIREESPSKLHVVRKYNRVMLSVVESQIQTPAMQQMMNDPMMKFDVCFFEVLAPHVNPLKDRFNCSLILISSFSGKCQHFDAFESPSNPIMYPDTVSPYLDNLNFWQRLYVVSYDAYYRYVYSTEVFPLIDEGMKRIFGEDTRPVSEILNEADMLFLNAHPIFGGIRPITPAVVFLGSLHIKPNKPLPSVSISNGKQLQRLKL